MNESQAIYQFASQFDIPAYAVTAVPDDAQMPYLTYEYEYGDLYSGEMLLEIHLWYKTESEAVPNAKVREILQAVPCNIGYDNGTIWITRGSPLAFAVPSDDNSIKCRQINLSVQYNTNL